MGLLSRNEILDIVDLPRETVNVPEWGGDVIVQGLNGTARDQYEIYMNIQRASGVSNIKNIRALLVSLCIIDSETDKLMFTIDDIPFLEKKSATALDRVFTIAYRLSGFGQKEIERLAENLD